MNDANTAALRLAAIIVALLGIFWFFVAAENGKGPQIVRAGSTSSCGVNVFFGCR